MSGVRGSESELHRGPAVSSPSLARAYEVADVEQAPNYQLRKFQLGLKMLAHPMKRVPVQPAQPQTLVMEFFVGQVLESTSEVLPGDHRLDHPRDHTLLVDIDQRLEMHRRREGRER